MLGPCALRVIIAHAWTVKVSVLFHSSSSLTALGNWNTGLTQDAVVLTSSEKRERKWWGSDRHYAGGEARNYISGFEGSQAVSPRLLVEVNAFFMTLERLYYCEIWSTIGRAAYEALSTTWDLGTKSASALGSRETTRNLDRVGRSQDLADGNCFLASSLDI
jgi:hypothetical protein